MARRGCAGDPQDAGDRGIRDRDLVKLQSRAGAISLHARITDRVAPGVVYTTFHHPDTQANVVTTEFSDWATNCPEYKVTAVQVTPPTVPPTGRSVTASWRATAGGSPWSRPVSATDPRDTCHIHASTTDRLVYMANQMATFFKAQPHDAAVAGVADHIKKFWDPRMKSLMAAHVAAGGVGLDAVALEALRGLSFSLPRLIGNTTSLARMARAFASCNPLFAIYDPI